MLCFVTIPNTTQKQYFDHSQVAGIDSDPKGVTIITLSTGRQITCGTALATVATNIARAPFDTTQTPLNIG